MSIQPIAHQNELEAEYPTKPLDRERIHKIIQLLDEWMADESGYDEDTWPELKKALNRERDNVSARRLFDE
ncbi:MAG: hypothetical protein GY749_06395 [Desulfobacteraceae bacterium]|nr:hypothetical protein [Desulfobacteraceae bacterium]